MSVETLVCPDCGVKLRCVQPIVAGKRLRCLRCGCRFPALVDEPDWSSVVEHAAAPAARDRATFAMRFLAGRELALALLLTVLVAGATIVGGLYWAGEPEESVPPPPMAKDERTRPAVDANEQQRLAFQRLMIRAAAALAHHDFDDAVQAYSAALQLLPESVEAAKGLSAARAGLQAQARDQQADEQRRAELERCLTAGREALAAKQYAAAARAFESALVFAPADKEAGAALAEARKLLADDEEQKKKLADHEARMTAGHAAMVQQRYADAVREFAAAQQVLPNDPAAHRARQQAERRLDEQQRQADYARLMKQAADAAANRRLDEAVKAYEDALKHFPNDPDAQQGLKQARQAFAEARAEFNRLVALGDGAMRMQRYEEAVRIYGEALKLFPRDDALLRNVRLAERAGGDLATLQAAYLRYMTQGTLAMRNQRYGEAVQAYQEALRLAPGDREAAQRLQEVQGFLEVETRVRPAVNQHLQAGAQALSNQQIADALRHFQEAQRLLPNDPQVLLALRQASYAQHMSRGQAAFAAGRNGDAAREFEAALRDAPGDPAATNALRQVRAGMRK